MYLIKFGEETFVAESIAPGGDAYTIALNNVSAAMSVRDHLVRHSVVFPYAELPRGRTILLKLPTGFVVEVQS